MCKIIIGGSEAFEGHKFTLTANAPDIDVRRFVGPAGGQEWGEFLSCQKDATIDVDCYVAIDSMEPSDDVTISMEVGTHTYVAPHCKCTNVTISVDAKDVVNFTYQFRVSEELTGW